jgi:hypothetical protein
MAHRSTGAEQTAAGNRILPEHSEACKDILSTWNDEGLMQNRKQSVALAIYKNGYKCDAVRRIVDNYDLASILLSSIQILVPLQNSFELSENYGTVQSFRSVWHTHNIT